MKKLLTIACLFMMVFTAKAQRNVGGEWSLGGRFGGVSGISLKHHAKSNLSALELIAAVKNLDSHEEMDGLTFSLMYHKLAHLSGNGKLNALIGGGVNANFNNDFNFGLSAALGFDWRLGSIPLTLQLDWMPTWIFVNASYFSGVNGAFTARYVLNRRAQRVKERR
jgi:hypothetical protein